MKKKIANTWTTSRGYGHQTERERESQRQCQLWDLVKQHKRLGNGQKETSQTGRGKLYKKSVQVIGETPSQAKAEKPDYSN